MKNKIYSAFEKKNKITNEIFRPTRKLCKQTSTRENLLRNKKITISRTKVENVPSIKQIGK